MLLENKWTGECSYDGSLGVNGLSEKVSNLSVIHIDEAEFASIALNYPKQAETLLAWSMIAEDHGEKFSAIRLKWHGVLRAPTGISIHGDLVVGIMFGGQLVADDLENPGKIKPVGRFIHLSDGIGTENQEKDVIVFWPADWP